jgi:sn-glycerol 3-phosphate transport system permease protein
LAAVSTLVDSSSTPKGKRPGVWVGLENYAVMTSDPVF